MRGGPVPLSHRGGRPGAAFGLDATAGIIPQRIDGFDGVFFSPFLHHGFDHLYSNSIPLILLGTFVLAAGTRRFLWSTLVIVLVSGLGVWFTGSPNSVVVGASGVIFGYLGILLTRGIVERSWWNFAVFLLVGLLYGWQLVGILPTDERISWQGHLFGLLGGVVAAILFRRTTSLRPDRRSAGLWHFADAYRRRRPGQR